MASRYICLPPAGKNKYILPVVGIVGFLVFWTLVASLGLVEVGGKNALPTPWETLQAFLSLFTDTPAQIPNGDGTFREPTGLWDKILFTPALFHGVDSVERIAKAVFYASLVGIPIGILMGAFGTIEGLISVLVMPMRNAPIIAFIPVFMILFGIEETMKIGFLMLGTIVYIIPATFDAVRNVPTAIVDKAVDHGFRPLGTLWYYVLPSALPRIFDGIRICTGIAWTYLVAAEIVNTTTGLGAVIQQAKRFQEMPKVYAGILLIILLGIITDALFRLVQSRFPVLQQELKA